MTRFLQFLAAAGFLASHVLAGVCAYRDTFEYRDAWTPLKWKITVGLWILGASTFLLALIFSVRRYLSENRWLRAGRNGWMTHSLLGLALLTGLALASLSILTLLQNSGDLPVVEAARKTLHCAGPWGAVGMLVYGIIAHYFTDSFVVRTEYRGVNSGELYHSTPWRLMTVGPGVFLFIGCGLAGQIVGLAASGTMEHGLLKLLRIPARLWM